LAAGTDQGDVVVWNVNRGSKESEYTAHSGGVTSIGFAPDRFAIASCGKDKRLRFRDVLSGKWIDTLEGFADDSPFCTFSHDGETLAVRGTSYSVKLVSTKTGRETLSFENLPANPMAVVFGHDDEFLSAMLEDGSIRTWRGSRRPPSGVETALAKR
jgi:WD40 repeat protein